MGDNAKEKDERLTGWVCPRCHAVNAPDVKRCDCEPGPEDQRQGFFRAGPSETK